MLDIITNLQLVRRRLLDKPDRQCQVQPLKAIETVVIAAEAAVTFYQKRAETASTTAEIKPISTVLHWRIEAMAAWLKSDMTLAESADLSPTRMQDD